MYPNTKTLQILTVSKQSACYEIILSISFPIKKKKKLFMKTKRVEVKLKLK